MNMMSIGFSSWESDGGMSPLMIALIAVFVLILGGVIGRGLWAWIRNNRSPRQTVDARIVAKRMNVSGFGHTMMGRVSAMNQMGTTTRTRYFATFETADGRRLELGVKDREYGVLAEGDCGCLSFQGTRYLGFDRALAAPIAPSPAADGGNRKKQRTRRPHGVPERPDSVRTCGLVHRFRKSEGMPLTDPPGAGG